MVLNSLSYEWPNVPRFPNHFEQPKMNEQGKKTVMKDQELS